MRIRGNEIIVHRNETFTIDFNIVMRDGAPFIVPKTLENPYLLLSISSAKYSYIQEERYLCNWWLPLDSIPRFDASVPIAIDEFTSDNLSIDGLDYVYTAIEDGVRKYKYWDKTTSTFKDYAFRVIKSFIYDEVKDWSEQSYTYSLTFVNGQDSYAYLQSVWQENWGEIPIQLNEAWTIAVAKDPSILQVLESDTPICNYSDVLTIIEPSKLTVLSNIRGSL